MYRIRFHGRGGQGIKTAGRILGSALFLEGLEVQDAPRYGAERRGAPLFCYVRAGRKQIHERGIIRNPDLIVVADESLLPVPAAGVLTGAAERTVLLLRSDIKADLWKDRLKFPGRLLILPGSRGPGEFLFAGAVCAGAAARLVKGISSGSLLQAVHDELAPLGETIIKKNYEKALGAYHLMADHAGCVNEGKNVSADGYEIPDWIDMPFEEARSAAPAIHAGATSVEIKTGLWRTVRPVIDYHRCGRCWWICSTLCPDSVISLNGEGFPVIDYDHCKGCMVCAAGCLRHAIETVPEHAALGEGAL